MEKPVVAASPALNDNGIPVTYQLRKNTVEGLLNSNGRSEEKESNNVYLKESHWKGLDKEAEKRGISRNQLLRNILDEYFGGGAE